MPATATTLLNRLLARGKFRHIQILLKLAELGSIQRTADAIGVTQSSVTQTLAYLEALLETPLFQRHAKGVHPTPACLDLLPLARQMLLGIRDTAQAVEARQRQGEGQVRLAASISATNGLLIDTLSAFHVRWPQIQIHLREAENDEQLQAIARGEVDLVACRRPPVIPEGWVFHALLEDRFAIVCRAGHPLARRGAADRDALESAVWMALPSGSAAREQLDSISARCRQPLQLHPLVTRTATMLWWLLLNHDLLTVLPLTMLRPLLRSGEIVELQVAGSAPMEPLGLLLPAERPTPAAQQLGDFLRAYFKA
ncbi:LysR family transcriptional regulator [Comamonas antarctica]|uniref:LysR family transcriptional regulator n=1 Tax=Comamonas antarctica TaxID=2743470 RepID=A0A6N1X9U2_9BURK|nr:LysR family transcriptional regulator [Comamonas antarctica]QKV55173.1 LysR family transcriptional regulator [Comamonas antarctica]